jgi:lysophospholipase L1-like esterase
VKRLTWLLVPLLLIGCAPSSPFAGVKNLYEAKGTSVVCFGNSITAGMGAASGEDYPTLLGQNVKLPVINLGESGDTTESALLRVGEILKRNPRIVIVELGGNDYLRRMTVSDTFKNLRLIIDEIQRQKAVVILVAMPLGSAYESGYKNLAREKGCVLIASLMSDIFDNQNLMADQLHPNSRGYQKMAEEIGRVLNELLAEMSP